jgi:hypothetical protein
MAYVITIEKYKLKIILEFTIPNYNLKLVGWSNAITHYIYVHMYK